jgi:hypothetical protein
MRFICDSRTYDTDDMHMIATGQAYMPILFVQKDFSEALAVVQSREGVTARRATRAEVERLHRQAPHPHLAAFLYGHN